MRALATGPQERRDGGLLAPLINPSIQMDFGLRGSRKGQKVERLVASVHRDLFRPLAKDERALGLGSGSME